MKNYVTVYKFSSKRLSGGRSCYIMAVLITTTITTQNDKYLLSYTNMMPVYSNKLPRKDDAEQIAMDVMEKVDQQYASGLT
ncbi:hypothetical protein ACT7DA_14565 [Bacillus pacificus]